MMETMNEIDQKTNTAKTRSNLLAPKLRFKEFNGWWKKTHLKNISEKVNSGKTPLGGNSVYVPDGILFIRSQNVLDNKLSFENSTFITNEINNTMKNSIVKSNDILLNITGASLGRSCVVPENFSIGNVNQHVCIIRLTKENNPYFLQPIFASEKGQNLFTSLQTGSGREGLNFQSIKKIVLNIPTLPEQQKIASFLSAVDEKIQQLTRKKELLEQYKKGVMQQLFSGELRFKDENGKDYPDWEEKRLGEVADFLKGKGISKLEIDNDGKTECIRYGQLYTDYKETISKVISRTSVSTKDLVLSKANDVIIPASGETQIDIATASCVLRSGIALGGDLNIIRTNMSGVFLSYYLNTHKKFDIARLSQGITVVHLYPSQLGLLKLSIPCLEEQQKIATFLSSIDTKIESVTYQITQTQTFKKGLLQQLFV